MTNKYRDMVCFKDFFRLLTETHEILMPCLFDALKQTNHPLASVHFTQHSQLSNNPLPGHSDPIGIYCFPKRYVFNGSLKKNTGFASYSNYMILEPSEQAKILNLDMDEQTAFNTLESMGIPSETLYNPKVEVRGVTKEQASIGHLFWGTMEYWRHLHKLSKNSSWNTLFRKTGYNTLYDPGKGIIHWNEKSQIVFLDRKAYRVVDIVQNNFNGLIEKLTGAFPEFKLKFRSGRVRDRKAEQAERRPEDRPPIYKRHLGEYYFEKGPDFFKIQVTNVAELPVIDVNGKVRINYSYQGDLNDIVDDIKDALKNFPNEDRYLGKDVKEENEPLFALAQRYNLKVDGSKMVIDRKYLDRSDPENVKSVLFRIFFTPERRFGNMITDEHFNCLLKSSDVTKGKEGFTYDERFKNYNFYCKVDSDGLTPEEVVDALFKKLDAKIENDKDLGNEKMHALALRAEKTLKLIKSRVFWLKKA